MMDEVRKIMELLPTTQEISNKDSFFDIIGRGHDEDLISRMLKYLFENRMEILNYIFEEHKNEIEIESRLTEIINIDCEKSTSNGKRIDLFIEGIDDSNAPLIIVIENKIYSIEHDNQCAEYYDYVKKMYPTTKSIFLYLKPSYNPSEPKSCSEYVVITYDDLYLALEELDSKTEFEKDFMRTINNNLKEVIMEEIDYMILKNYNRLKERMTRALTEINKHNRVLATTLAKKLNLKLQITDADKTFRFYKEDWKKENEYYFYIEILYRDGFSNWTCNQTVRCDRQKGTLPMNFFDEKGFEKATFGETTYYFKKQETIPEKINEVEILSKEWENILFNWASEQLSSAKSEQEKLFEEFSNYRTSIN